MHRSIIDLEALRNRTGPGAGEGQTAWLAQPLSRRRALGMAGVAAAGASPVLRLTEAPSLGAVSVIQRRNLVIFALDKRPCWVIDTRRFAGRPRIALTRTAQEIRVSLTGARYPGTPLSADFHCLLRHGTTGWRMQIRMALGDFAAEVPLERWLAGLEPAQATVHLTRRTCALGTRAALVLKGAGTATFSPDGIVRLEGHQLVALRGLGDAPLLSDSVAISAATAEAASAVQVPAARRTLILLQRGNAPWHLPLPTARSASWVLRARPGTFETIRLEVGEGRPGAVNSLVAEGAGSQSQASLTFQPHPSLTAQTGQPLTLGLSQAVYAVAFHPSGDEMVLLARYQHTAWLHVGGCALEIGEGAGAPPFELQARGGAVTSLLCTPAALRMTAPLANAVVEPGVLASGTQVAFVAAGLASAPTQHPVQVHVVDDLVPIVKLFIAEPALTVLRPDDLLSLRFQFSGLTLVTASGRTPELHVDKTKHSSTIAVYFQGQNIAEQAFFTHVAHFPVTPPDPDAGHGDETPFMPVQTRIAGESRLVFTVPSSAKPIPFTLAALLDWQQFDPSVAATAQPPGGRARATVGAPAGTETAIEAPWRLILSPNQYAAWIHAFDPVTHGGRTELWHTRLGVRISPQLADKAHRPDLAGLYDLQYQYLSSGGRYVVGTEWNVGGAEIDVLGAIRTVRAIWSPDYPTTGRPNAVSEANTPFRMSLNARDRAEIVQLSADFSHVPSTPPHFIPITPIVIHAHLSQGPALAPRPLGAVGVIDQTPTGASAPPTIGSVAHEGLGHPAAGVEPSVAPPQVYIPLPIAVNRLMLTTLGTWIDVRGAWGLNPFGDAVEEWRHRGTMGRDHYVRVVYRGYLFPFGHRASLVKVTERKFLNQNKRNVAYLFQRMFILVREPLKTYGATNLTDNQGNAYIPSGLQTGQGRSIDRWMPFKQVQITTLATPDLDQPRGILAGHGDQDAFWPRVNSQDFLFHLIATDGEGQRTEFTAPLAFITYDGFLMNDETQMDAVARQYAGLIATPQATAAQVQARRTRPTNGQNVAFAPSRKQGDTTLHALDVTFSAFVPKQSVKLADDQPRFYPIMGASTVNIPALEALLHTGQSPKIGLSDHFLINSLDGSPNVGEVFAEIIGGAPSMTFGGSNSNGTGTAGVVTPNLDINGLSRTLGPIGGDISQVANGSIPDPGAFLQNFFNNSAKILGAIPLSDIIQLPDLSPIFNVIALIQSVENYPQTLSTLAAQAQAALQGNLSALSAQALAALQGPLTALQGELTTLKTALQTVKNALNAIPSAVLSLLGDFGAPLSDLNTLLGDLNTLLSDLGTLLADVQASKLSALQGDANTLQNDLSTFPDDLTKLVQDLGNIPGLNALPKLNNTSLPAAIDTTFTWAPHLKADPLNIFKPGDQFLSVTAKIHLPLDGSSPSFNLTGTLGKFDLSLFNVIGVSFGGLTFTAQSDEKPDVTVGDVKVGFQGPLAFVNDLASIIPNGGFNDPPYLDVKPDGIEAGFTVDIPSLGVGILSLQNISLGASVTVPFIGSEPARLRFNFCTRENPFLLTVSLFGGGGFFAIGVGLDGLEMLEASFEFGGNFSLDLGVASGGVYVMAGIYFKVQMGPPDDALLTGYLQMGGNVDVLGIISISVEFYMGLTYENSGGHSKVYGDATLTVSVSVLFFSASVSLSVHREFAGSDPTFQDQISAAEWQQYLDAFAA